MGHSTVRQAFDGARTPASIRFSTSLALIALIAGCQPGATGGGDATRAASPRGSVQLVDRDVEAPEIFQVKDSALWDGRPSLGGVWVAAPGVTDPERVLIRNPGNGKTVVGALFKRERDNPGPPLQLSSDAAASLGILAGSPSPIDVVALRREEVSAPAVPPVVPAETGAILTAGADPTMAEATPEVAAVEPAPQEATAVATAAVAALNTSGTPAPVAVVQAEPRRGNIFTRIFRRGRQAPAPMPDETAMPEPVAATAVAVTQTSLDAPAAPTTGGGVVQVATFSVEKNARAAGQKLTDAGLSATVQAQDSGNRQVWRVLATPSGSTGDRAAVIRKVRDLGFPDAFATRG